MADGPGLQTRGPGAPLACTPWPQQPQHDPPLDLALTLIGKAYGGGADLIIGALQEEQAASTFGVALASSHGPSLVA